MDINDLKKYIKLAKDEGLHSLKIDVKDAKFEFQFAASTESFLAPSKAPQRSPAVVETETVKEKFHEIKSPFVGTFYHSPGPGKASFVKVGERISKGKVLCILEAMKIMNEIESDVAGEIVEMGLENESLVEYGQVLFRIRKDN